MSSNNDSSELQSVYNNIETNYKNELLRLIMKTQFTNAKMKITDDVLSLINEISKAIVVEAAIRASKHAISTGKKRVELEHVEPVLPQLVLDLP